MRHISFGCFRAWRAASFFPGLNEPFFILGLNWAFFCVRELKCGKFLWGCGEIRRFSRGRNKACSTWRVEGRRFLGEGELRFGVFSNGLGLRCGWGMEWNGIRCVFPAHAVYLFTYIWGVRASFTLGGRWDRVSTFFSSFFFWLVVSRSCRLGVGGAGGCIHSKL